MKHYLISLIFLVPLFTNAQNEYHNNMIDMFWGEEVVSVHKQKQVRVLGQIDEHYFIFTDGRLEKYDENFELLKSNPINLMYKKYHQKFEQILLSHEKIYLFTSYVNIKLKKKFLFVQQINLNTLTRVGQLKKVAEVSVKKAFNDQKFHIINSKTNKAHLIFYVPKKSKEINFLVFDYDFNEIWRKENINLGKNQGFDIEQLCLDDEYNLHVLGIVHDFKNFKKYKSYKEYFYQITSFFKKGAVEKTNKVAFDNYIIVNVKMVLNKNKNLLISGTYITEKEKKEGVLYLKMNKNSHQIVSQKFNDLPSNFFKYHIYEKSLSRGHPAIFDYLLRNLHIHDNGEVTVIIEQHYVVEEVEHYPPARMMFYYHYHYNDLILFHYDIKGDLIWNKRINKRQVSHNDGGYFSSYASVQKDKDIYLVYNDHHKNYKKKESEKIHSFSNIMHNGVIAFTKIDIETGKMVSDVFTEVKKLDVFIIPKQAKLIEDELIMLGKKGRHHRLVKIKPIINQQ